MGADPAVGPVGEATVPVSVLVELPRHTGLGPVLTYLAVAPIAPGTLVRVPLGRRTVMGIAWAHDAATEEATADASALRPVEQVLDVLAPLTPAWRALVRFVAAYYQRSEGELALSVLPADLRSLDTASLQRRLKRLERTSAANADNGGPPIPVLPELSAEQAAALADWTAHGAAASLLFGSTGSGKTEVYLRAADTVLIAGRQVLVLVPEINLTPQLEARFRARFPGRQLVALHSGLTPAQRLQGWLAAHLGRADLVLGTRLAIFASMPRLGLIVVDEEHDPSYKQQEGARYSARDMAVYRGRLEQVPVLLGSATPSLESWHNAGGDLAPAAASAEPSAATPDRGAGRYRLLRMPQRIGAGALPTVRLVDLARLSQQHGSRYLREHPLAPPLVAALAERIERGEQSLILLNRRGYAPVLHCTGCGWKSACAHCSAWRVFHKLDRTLRCHHCGFTERVPRACPACGDPDLQPMGRGTERLEEQLGALLPGARIARIDADSTRAKGSLEVQLDRVHAGDVDVLVGTQMVAKGHDFRRMTLVAAVNADAALFSSDFRAPERLFALLMQAAGRAGRDAGAASRSEMWIQTWHPQHPLYAALRAHDYPAFARDQLAERRSAQLPPFAALALLRAEARTPEAALAFLHAAAVQAEALLAQDGLPVSLYPPVPAALQRVANVERAQMLIESGSRAALQRFLAAWMPGLAVCNSGPQRVLRWAVDVDPLAI